MRGATGAIKDLERRQKSRHTRASRDALDRALIDLATYFRDALLVSAQAGEIQPNHPDMADRVAAMAAVRAAGATVAVHRGGAGVPRGAGGQREAEVRGRRDGRHRGSGAAQLTWVVAAACRRLVPPAAPRAPGAPP